MRENKIERYLRKQVKAAGGVCYKWVSPGQRYVPDDIVMFPVARMCFVETKMDGKKPSKGQARMHAKLWRMGFPVVIIDSKPLVDSFVARFSAKPSGGPAIVTPSGLANAYHK